MIRIKSWNISVMWYFGNGQQAYYFNFIGICEKGDGDVNFSDLKHNGFPEMNTQPFYWRIGVRLDVKSDMRCRTCPDIHIVVADDCSPIMPGFTDEIEDAW